MRWFGRSGILLLAATLVAITLIVLLVYVPQGRVLGGLRTQIAAKVTAVEADARKAAVVPGLLRQIQDMKERYSNFDRRLPKRVELGAYLKDISVSMASQKLANPVIQPGDPTREALYNTLPITMSFRGNYLDLANFLLRLDKMERLTSVQKLKVTRENEQSDLTIEMSMNIYFTES